MENKKANLKEIVSEMGRDVKGVGAAVGKGVWNLGKYALWPHYIPTTVREEFAGKEDHEISGVSMLGRTIFGLGNTVAYTGVAAGSIYESPPITLETPEVFYIPLATNIASLMYEWGRGAKERIDQKYSGGKIR
jgi:hypothetical protein